MENTNKILLSNGFKVIKNSEISEIIFELNDIHMASFENPKNITSFNKIDFLANQKIYKSLVSQLNSNSFFIYKFNSSDKTSDSYFQGQDLYICYIHRRHPGKFVPLIKYQDFKQLKEKEKTKDNTNTNINDDNDNISKTKLNDNILDSKTIII